MKRNRRHAFLWVLVTMIVLLGAAACATRQTTLEQIESGLYADMPTVSSTASIRYEVKSSIEGFSLTYENKTGDTEQKDIYSDTWTYKWTGDPDDFLYVSAQLDGTGTIECWIYVDDVEVSHAESNGKYVIAKCSE